DVGLLLGREAALLEPLVQVALEAVDTAVDELLEGLRLHRVRALVVVVVPLGRPALGARREGEGQGRGGDQGGSDACKRRHGINLQAPDPGAEGGWVVRPSNREDPGGKRKVRQYRTQSHVQRSRSHDRTPGPSALVWLGTLRQEDRHAPQRV